MLCEGASYQDILGTSTDVTVELTQPALCVKDRQELGQEVASMVQ